MAAEWAAVCLLAALVSPLCWKQHLVLAIPCLYLAMREHLIARGPPKWRTISLVLIGMFVVLTKRFLWDRETALLLMSYKFDTVAVLLAMLLGLTLPSNHKADDESSEKLNELSTSPRTIPSRTISPHRAA